MKLTISGYSTALFATWYFIEELGILFDAGDGAGASLTQKTGKIRHIFISHADRDHVTGLLQLNQHRIRPGSPQIYYPSGCNTFPALHDFLQRFDPQIAPGNWVPIAPGEGIRISKEWLVKPVINGHISGAGDQVKSLSYIVCHVRQKLKPAFAALSGAAIGEMRQQGMEVMEALLDPVLAYSGDTPVEDPARYAGVQTLIHEATFLEPYEISGLGGRHNRHSSLPEVIAMVARFPPERLILGHFSRRYDPEQIIAGVRRQCSLHGIAFPVYVVLPGQVHTDLLSQPPVWPGV